MTRLEEMIMEEGEKKGFQKGREEGMKKGLQRGMESRRLRLICDLIRAGMEDEKILKLPEAETTKEELERLRRKMGREME